ncbi:Suppressor of Ty 7 [Chamberlinius hualienensis]
MMARWGEIPLDPDTESGIAAIEREHITKPRPMELDGPLLCQPNKLDQSSYTDTPVECTFGDAKIAHTIALNQYAKKMKVLVASLQQNENSDPDVPLFIPTMPVMESNDQELYHKAHSLTRCFESKFRQGIGVAPPEITEQLAKKILRKAVAVMCAHAGFDTTTECVLETLIDVTHEYYLKITRLLRADADRAALVRGTAFPDVVEQVCHEIGIGSMRNLVGFYQKRVVEYHKDLVKTCQKLTAEYKKLKSPEILKENIIEEIIKEEDVPQIHFPSTDDFDENHPITEATIHLDEFHNLQVVFENETAHVGAEEDESKQGVSVKSEYIFSIPT